MALADFLHPPEILGVDLDGYSGKAEEIIKISAADDFCVKDVRVMIHKQNGKLIEEGETTQRDAEMMWRFELNRCFHPFRFQYNFICDRIV